MPWNCQTSSNRINTGLSGLYKKTGLFGFLIDDEGKIFLAYQIPTEKEKIITLLHELFHIFFYDYNDTRENIPEKNDKIEQRAENSAINMYNWYIKNKRQYNNFLKYVNKIPISKYTKKDETI